MEINHKIHYLFDGDIIEIKKVNNLDKDILSITSTSLSLKNYC